MANLITHTAKLLPYARRPKHSAGFVTAYSYEPIATELGAQNGNLYAVIEVLAAGRQSQEVSDLIIEALGRSYYDHDSTGTALAKFEQAIKAVNHELAGYVSNGNAAWIGKLSAVIALQIDTELHVTQTGSAEAYLYRGHSSTQITTTTQRPMSPSKTFGTIASGDMEVADRLLLATPALIHQLPMDRLKGVITDASPANAIAEITRLLSNDSTDRIAALVIELTTPEAAALEIRNESPDEIQLGAPETTIEAVKDFVAPLAQAAGSSSKMAAQAVKSGWEKSKPHVDRASQAALKPLGITLKPKRRIHRIIIAVLLLVVLLIIVVSIASSRAHTQKLRQSFNDDLTTYKTAAAQGEIGRPKLITVHKKLISFTPADVRVLNHSLSSANLVPNSVGGLIAEVQHTIDIIDGMTTIQPLTITDFQSSHGDQKFLDYHANEVATISSGVDPQITIVNISTKTSHIVPNTNISGSLTAITPASDGSGFYMSTNTKNVYFFNYDTASVSLLNSKNSWVEAKAMSAYNGNLYILDGSNVIKYLRTGPNSFAVGVPDLPSGSAGLRTATALAVDGNIYLASSDGIRQYLAGQLKIIAKVPTPLTSLGTIRISNHNLVAADPRTGEIGTWMTSPSFSYANGYNVATMPGFEDVVSNADGSMYYALRGNDLVEFSGK